MIEKMEALVPVSFFIKISPLLIKYSENYKNIKAPAK